MSADATAGGSDPRAAPGQGSGEPTEEELRAAYEAELSRITSTDLIAQAVVSLLNIGARRLGMVAERPAGEEEGPPGSSGRDLEQVRDAIDAVRALLDILERRIPAAELGSLREALSQLQMAYAREVQAADEAAAAPPGGGAAGGQQPATGGKDAPAEGEGGPAAGKDEGDEGPAVSSGRLWVPGR
jgi:hypothetical protein